MKSTTRVTFTGLNLERLLNFLVKNGVSLLKVVRLNKKTCRISVERANSDKVIAILKEKCYTITEVRHTGPYGFWQLCKKHVALFVAGVLALPLLAVSSLFCWQIDVESSLPAETVYAALEKCGVRRGALLTSLHYDALENRLAAELDVSYAIVDRQGSRLTVKIVDKVSAGKPIDLTQACDVVASASGVVTKISVISGTAAVAVGDKVEKGQVLIYGRRTYNDGTSEAVRAVGEVYAERTVSGRAQFIPSKREYLPSGQVFFRTVIYLGAFVSQKDVPFAHWRIAEEKSAILAGGISAVTQKIEELTEVVREYTLEECLPELKAQALEEALAKADFLPSDTQYMVSDGAVTVILKGEKQIGDSRIFGGNIYDNDKKD